MWLQLYLLVCITKKKSRKNYKLLKSTASDQYQYYRRRQIKKLNLEGNGRDRKGKRRLLVIRERCEVHQSYTASTEREGQDISLAVDLHRMLDQLLAYIRKFQVATKKSSVRCKSYILVDIDFFSLIFQDKLLSIFREASSHIYNVPLIIHKLF